MLSADGQAGKVYELAGDRAYTLAEFAAELSRQAGKPVAYRDLPEAEYKAVLLGAGLPEPLADALADEDQSARGDTLFDDSGTLAALIGRPATPMWETIAEALCALGSIGPDRRRPEPEGAVIGCLTR